MMESDKEVVALKEEEEDDDDYTDPSDRVEPNKFDNLCDGVITSLAMVHENLKQFMDFKDELLLHSLPPNVLLKMGLMSGKVFRSISDLHMPLNELIRLVRVYSTPWEEKSEALKKLHESYEKKSRQLNIAIHRLAMVDENTKRMEREKKVLNWEKLFSAVMTTKGHGRRWKFRMKDFKGVAKQGFEAVQAYVDSLDAENAEFQDLTEQDDDREKQEEEEVTEPEAEEERPGSTPDLDATTVTMVPAEKAEMRDRCLWTHEPEYDRSLRARVFRPTGLNKEWYELKCKLTYGQFNYKTKSLDPEVVEEEEEKEEEKEEKKPARGLIGMRGRGRGGKGGVTRKDVTKKKKEPELVFEDCEFQVADEIDGDSHGSTLKQEIVRVSIHHGGREQMVAMATIEMEDLQAIDLPILFENPPEDDVLEEPKPAICDDSPTDLAAEAEKKTDDVTKTDDVIKTDDAAKTNVVIKTDDVTEAANESKFSKDEEEKLKEVNPLNFPLYSIFGGKADAQKPCGQLPLIFYWVKRLRPKTRTRFAATDTFDEVVLNVTGIDLKNFTKGDLVQSTPEVETEERACSAFEDVQENNDEVVSQEAYEALMEKHKNEMEQLRSDYQTQMNAMGEGLISLQDQLYQAQQNQRNRQARNSAKSVQDGRVSKSSINSTLNSVSRPSSKHLPSDASRHSLQLHDQASRVSIVSELGGSPYLGLVAMDEPLQHPSSVDPVAIPTPAGSSAGESPGVTFHYPVAAVMASSSVTSDRKNRTQPPAGGSVGTFKDVKKNQFIYTRSLPAWSEGLSSDFQERQKIYAENRARHREELEESRSKEVRGEIERRLECEFKLSKGDDDIVTALQDVNLPALFMPTTSTTGLYNPRAHQYFHPGGSTALRISQPPSMVTLPPLPKHKVSVLNMFDMSNNFARGPDYLLKKFIEQQEEACVPTDAPAPSMDVRPQNSVLSGPENSEMY